MPSFSIHGTERPTRRLTLTVTSVLLLVCLIWVYWPTLVRLSELWANDPKYSHGYLVPVFSLFLFGAFLRHNSSAASAPSTWGVPVIIGALLLRAAGIVLFYPTLEALSLIPLVAGCVLCVGGWVFVRATWPAIVFLVLMLPLPYRLESALAGPLQEVATSASVYFMQTLGFPAYADGNIIHLQDGSVNVAEACNGLSMIMMFAALSAAVVVLSDRHLLDNFIILLSAVPIAIVCNVVRIVASAILYVSVGHTIGDLLPFTQTIVLPGGQVLGAIDIHDFNGYLMMPLALVLLWLELKILSWVFVEPARRPSSRTAHALPGPGAETAGSPVLLHDLTGHAAK